MEWVEARDAAQPPAVPRTTPPQRTVPPKCQQCRAGDPVLMIWENNNVCPLLTVDTSVNSRRGKLCKPGGPPAPGTLLLSPSPLRVWISFFSFLSFETEFRSCHPGWSAMARSRLTATSASWVQAILLPQSPE